jgi:hypothetical protein
MGNERYDIKEREKKLEKKKYYLFQHPVMKRKRKRKRQNKLDFGEVSMIKASYEIKYTILENRREWNSHRRRSIEKWNVCDHKRR